MDLLLNILLLAATLGLSALLTQWFARRMYITCRGCGILNARRRRHCRVCGKVL